MSTTADAIQTYANQVETNFQILNGALVNLKQTLTAQSAQIAAFQAQAAPSLSSEDAAALQKLVDDSAAAASAATGMEVPPAPVPPAAS